MGIVESKLSEQLNYLTQVSTGQPHEGSGYASAKVLQMAWHRIQHARSRVRELEDSRMKYRQAALQQNRAVSGTVTMGGFTAISTTPANGAAAASGNTNAPNESASEASAAVSSTSTVVYPPYNIKNLD